MENKKLELLLDLENKICELEEKYDNEKISLETLETSYILKNDWEKVLGKPKPTQKEKDAYVVVETEVRKRNVKKNGKRIKTYEKAI